MARKLGTPWAISLLECYLLVCPPISCQNHVKYTSSEDVKIAAKC